MLSLTDLPGALQNSQGNNREASDPPLETLRLLQLAVAEEDDATSKLVIPQSTLPMPPSHESHGHGQDSQNLNPELQVQGEAVVGGTTMLQQSLGQEMQGDCGGEVGSVASAMFHEQVSHLMSAFSMIEFEIV